MRKINDSALDGYVKQLIDNKYSFVVGRKRAVSCLYINGKGSVLSKKGGTIQKKKDENNSKIISIFSQVAKAVNKYIVSVNFDVPIVKQRYTSTATNRKKWESIKIGQSFCYVDVNHCFWRIAYMYGYIGEKLYNNTLNKPELKLYRNMALACIVAPQIREYYVRGVKVNEISEDKTLYSIIYNNIRYNSYNIMGEIMDAVGESDFIGYRTDGIMVSKKALSIVKEMLIEQGFSYTIEDCVKLDSINYSHKGKEL